MSLRRSKDQGLRGQGHPSTCLFVVYDRVDPGPKDEVIPFVYTVLRLHKWVDHGLKVRFISLSSLLSSMTDLILAFRSSSSLFLPCCCSYSQRLTLALSSESSFYLPGCCPWVSWPWPRGRIHPSTCLVVIHEWVDPCPEVGVIPLEKQQTQWRHRRVKRVLLLENIFI